MSEYDDQKWDEAIRAAEAEIELVTTELEIVTKRRRRLLVAVRLMRGLKKDGQPWPTPQQDSCVGIETP